MEGMAKDTSSSSRLDQLRTQVSKTTDDLATRSKNMTGDRERIDPGTPPERDPTFGAMRVRVIDIADPQGDGRVLVRLDDTVDADRREVWCRTVSMGAGDQRGIWFLPEIGDEVAVIFEGGDIATPLLLGGLWNSDNRPPVDIPSSGSNDVRSIVSRTGSQIEFNDENSSLTISTPAGHTICLDDSDGECEISDAAGNTIRLAAGSITITSTTSIELAAAATVNVQAATIDLDSALVNVSGALKADTLIATTGVISPSYTPGEGNIF